MSNNPQGPRKASNAVKSGIREWLDVVAQMRQPVTDLGREPSNASRLLLRAAAAHHAFVLQLRIVLDLSTSEMSAVLALWDGGRCTMSELGRRVTMKPASITALSDRLEKKGLIRRTPSPDDRRRLLLEVTPDADRILIDATGLIHAEAQKWLEDVVEDDSRGVILGRLHGLLRRLTQTMQAHAMTIQRSAAKDQPEPPPALDPHW